MRVLDDRPDGRLHSHQRGLLLIAKARRRATVYERVFQREKRNTATPSPTSAAVPPSTLATARGLLVSSVPGIAERMMVAAVLMSPMEASKMATGLPPGTR